jgi:E3 ubiquitin-protein ligase TRIP12
LQLVDLLLAKQPQLYKPTFRREGVFHEVDSLAGRTLSQSPKSKDKDKDKDKESPSAPDSGNVTPAPMIPPSSIPGYRKLSSLSLEPEDAITLRARVIQFRYLRVDEEKDEDDSFDFLRRLNDRLSSSVATEKEMTDALRELADLFASPRTSVSSFELMQSGVVDGLLRLATDQDRAGKAMASFNLLKTDNVF